MEVLKDLAGAEDLLLDAELPDIVVQSRGGTDYSITKVNAKTIPYTGTFGQSGVVSIKDKLDNIDTSIENLEYIVDTIEDLATYTGNGLVMVKDINRGGTFVSKTETEIDPNTGNLYVANGGTIFAKLGGGFWVRQYSGLVNVKWFGAKGDWNGTTGTDDTVAIQASLNFTSIKKQILFMGASRYLVTDTINIPEGGQILGETLYQYGKGFGIDPKATSIKFNPTSLKSLFKFNGTLHGSFRFHNSLQNLYLEGNSTSSTGNSNYALEIDDVIYATFKNISIDKSFRTGIKCNATINNEFYNIYTTGFIQGLEYVGNTETTDTWNRLTVFGTPKGITLGGTTVGLRFNNSLFEQVDDYGVDISATTQNAVFTNVYSEDVPFASNVSDNCVFRVGGFGTSNKAGIQLTVKGGSLRGKNSATIGSAFVIKDTDGVNIDIFVRKFVNAIDSTNATRDKSISLSNFIATSITRSIITDLNKIQGNYYSSQVSDVTLNQVARYENVYAGAYKPKNGSTSSLVYSSTTAYTFGQTNVYPSSDNTVTLGLSNFRWSTIYAGTGTINTSDDREKTYIDITDIEKKIALELKVNMKKFKFNNAINEKGEDNARIHFGASAQTVKSIFEKHGLNAFDYAILCYDEWEYQEELKDDEDNLIEEARLAGNRYGLRYEELLCFIMSAL